MEQVNDSIAQIKKFIELLETRARLSSALTHDMIQLLEPTVIQALHEVMQVDADNVSWVDVNVIDHMVVLDAIVSVRIDALSTFMLSITPPENLQMADEDDDVLEQVVKIGIPADLVFTNKQKIIDFINDTSTVTRKTYDGDVRQAIADAKAEASIGTMEDFDLSQLSADQRLALRSSKKVMH